VGSFVPYGIVYAFFAACAGDLRHATGDVPVACFRPGTSEALGQADFVFGYYPIYAYETLTNANPVLLAPSTVACTSDSACAAGQVCGAKGACVPVVAACNADKTEDCPAVPLWPVIDPASAERAVSSNVSASLAPLETLWVNYYATGGLFDKDARLVNDAYAGWDGDYGGVWRSKAPAGREVSLYAVVRDNRGGVTWISQDVAVR
jgi:hypothetical protein